LEHAVRQERHAGEGDHQPKLVSGEDSPAETDRHDQNALGISHGFTLPDRYSYRKNVRSRAGHRHHLPLRLEEVTVAVKPPGISGLSIVWPQMSGLANGQVPDMVPAHGIEP